MRGGVDILSIDSKMQVRCRDLMKKYKDLPMDLADGSLVVLAEINNIEKVFTLDHKDFQVYRFSRNQKFNLLPAHLG